MKRNKNRSAFLSVLFISLLLSALITGCATVPPESVELSKQVSTGISKARSAHLSTVNAYYNSINKDNDNSVVPRFLSKLIADTTSNIATACKKARDTSAKCSELSKEDTKTIIAKTIEFRDEMHRALSKNRDDVAHLINEHYAHLLSANSGITALLSSAVDVSKATKDSTALVSNVTGIDFDANAIEQALNKYLEKAGTAGAKISDLESDLSGIVNKQDTK